MHKVDLRRIDLNLLVALEALLREQSVTRAGQRIGRSQPAMSRALGRLRETLGDPLLVPSGRRLVPTQRALELQRQLGQVLDSVRGLLDTPTFDPKMAVTEFRINAPDATVMLLLSEFLIRAATLSPGMTFTIRSVAAGQYDALDSGELDLAVDTFVDAPDRFYRQSMLENRLVCLVRRGHPATRKRFDLEAFTRWPHIWVDTATSRAFDFLLERKGIRRHCAVRITNFLTGAAVAARTDYLLVLPSQVAARACEMSPLSTLAVPIAVQRLTLDQLWHPRLHHDPAHTWLRRTIFETAQLLWPHTDPEASIHYMHGSN